MFVYNNPSVYEALGSYVDSLSGSLYLGTARGRVLFNGKEISSGRPRFALFFRGFKVEISGRWGKGNEFIFVRGKPRIRYHRLSGLLEVVFSTEKGDLAFLLNGEIGLARTLKSALKECKDGKTEMIGVSL